MRTARFVAAVVFSVVCLNRVSTTVLADRPLLNPNEDPNLLNQPLLPLLVHNGLGSSGSGCAVCNNSATCCDGESCCSGGTFCCSTNSTCCSDTCCNSPSETCCPDPINGGVCCMTETTFCCKPSPAFDHPSRCCPRWYVCCDYGRYGCCNPQSGAPLGEEDTWRRGYDRHPHSQAAAAADRIFPPRHHQPGRGAGRRGHDDARERVRHTVFPASSSSQKGFGLFLEPTWIGPMVFQASTINLTSGSRAEVHVSGFHTEQETTRTFMYDRTRQQFLLLQANFTDVVPGTKGDHPVHLFTIDPQTGATDVQRVVPSSHGDFVLNEVTGYRLLPNGSIVFATALYDPESAEPRVGGTRTVTGYAFYVLHTPTAVATRLAVHNLEPTNSSTGSSGSSSSAIPPYIDDYAGWFHEAAPDGLTLYRLGYRDVVTSDVFGVSVTSIHLGNGTTTTSFTMTPRPDGTHGHYRSLNLRPGTHPSSSSSNAAASLPHFYSLAPSWNTTRYGDLALFRWSLSNPYSSPKKIATFPNAHTTPYFGPINEAFSADGRYYGAVIVQDSILGTDYDTWGLGVVDLDVEGSVDEVELTPGLLAVTASVSGFGFAA